MANIKFSQFTTQTDPANVQFVVGYNGTTNVKIAPGDIGGGGATSLNGLTDCLVDTASLYVGEVPAGLSGNPQSNTILGIDAGESLTTGDSNTLIGNNAGDSITGGTNSVAIGFDALATATTAGSSVAIGCRAYKNGTAGNQRYGRRTGLAVQHHLVGNQHDRRHLLRQRMGAKICPLRQLPDIRRWCGTDLGCDQFVQWQRAL